MRAAVYARFSSENQREQSIEDQIRVCREFANRNGIAILESHIYFDEAQSGAVRSRPGLEALKKAGEDKQFDAVLVDDSSRLSRDNQHFNTLLCLFQYWGVSLISVSDGLDTREEHAKVAYQFRGIINELYLTDLKKKTHRGQMGQVLRGFSVGSRGYGYASVPEGESKYDKKGRLRADGFKLVIVPEEARIVQRIFRAFIDGKAVTKIAKELNDERVPTKVRLKGGWNVSTVSRILKDEKYIGRFVWNRTTTVKEPLSGKMKQVERPKEEWVVQERRDIRIISDEDWHAAQARWREIDGVFPRKKGKKGFEGKRKSYVESHPTHLLSGALKCGACGGAIALVSGKGSGYYGCLNASRHSCENKVLIARKRIEDKFVAALNEAVLRADVLELVYERTAKKIKEQFAHVPEELRLKKVELNRAETRVHNFIEFIASGRATAALADALAQAEEQVKTLTADVVSMEAAREHIFTPPPRAWITERIRDLNGILAQRTEKSALELRRLTGPVTLTPEKPDIGRPYFRVACKFDALNLLVADGGSNLLRWWRRRESNSALRLSSVVIRLRLRKATGIADRRFCRCFRPGAVFVDAGQYRAEASVRPRRGGPIRPPCSGPECRPSRCG
ncbi:MAG TPA: recombinase family protein [Polyangiaceae bacterium]|nr:recombinase family protein [Polyangiaceae bacterium]